MTSDYYANEAVAQAYDADNAGQPITTEDIPFYVALAKDASAEGQSVLELGCGTGRVTIPMAKAGADVVGLDSSAEMLAVARAKAEGMTNVRWVQGDMARFELEQRFGLVNIPFRSFLLLLTVEQQKSCLACIREHLVDSGRLALNFFNPDLALMAAWNTAKRGLWEHQRLGRDRELRATRTYHTGDQQLEETHEYLQVSHAPAFQAGVSPDTRSGAVIARLERNLRLRYVFRFEMEHLLALSGFEVDHLYGWFDGRPFDDDSSEMVWTARRL